MNILVLNGPNLNMLGVREPEIYGRESWADVEARLHALATALGVQLTVRQSNHEGDLIDILQNLQGIDGVILNAAALTHTSIGLRDVLTFAKVPVVEVHITNISAREEFRRSSLLTPVCRGIISGLGTNGYLLALRYLVGKVE